MSNIRIRYIRSDIPYSNQEAFPVVADDNGQWRICAAGSASRVEEAPEKVWVRVIGPDDEDPSFPPSNPDSPEGFHPAVVTNNDWGIEDLPSIAPADDADPQDYGPYYYGYGQACELVVQVKFPSGWEQEKFAFSQKEDYYTYCELLEFSEVFPINWDNYSTPDLLVYSRRMGEFGFYESYEGEVEFRLPKGSGNKPKEVQLPFRARVLEPGGRHKPQQNTHCEWSVLFDAGIPDHPSLPGNVPLFGTCEIFSRVRAARKNEGRGWELDKDKSWMEFCLIIRDFVYIDDQDRSQKTTLVWRSEEKLDNKNSLRKIKCDLVLPVKERGRYYFPDGFDRDENAFPGKKVTLDLID